MKKIYVAMIGDVVHPGHVNIIKAASELGELTIGLYTDHACSKISRVPFLDFEKRKAVVENIKGVTDVVAQDSPSYEKNLIKLQPDIVVHGDDWVNSAEKYIRKEVINILSKWGGELVEIPYTTGISSSALNEDLKSLGITSTQRMGRLRRLLAAKSTLRILEVHSGLSGLVAETTKVHMESGVDLEFDGMWSSSLTDSTAKGKPDIEAVDVTSRLQTVNDIFEVTTKPMIYDADTGGKPEHFQFTVRSLERTGVSAVIIEDKTGLKKNSLFGTEVAQTQDDIESFCLKIRMGKSSQVSTDFMIIARVESLILDAGMDDALTRAKAYVEAGADGIMIHSRHKDPTEIISFIEKFRAEDQLTPLVVVPSSFNTVTVEEFERLGVNLVIYANHMLRSAYPGMRDVATAILKNGRTFEIEDKCLSIKEILELVPGTK